jgi:hypothetical protein
MTYLSQSEYEILCEYYEKDPNWKRATVKAAAADLKMTTRKIYKWGYDRKVKEMKVKVKSMNKNAFRISSKICLRDDIFLEDTTNTPITNYNQAVNSLLEMLEDQMGASPLKSHEEHVIISEKSTECTILPNFQDQFEQALNNYSEVETDSMKSFSLFEETLESDC